MDLYLYIALSFIIGIQVHRFYKNNEEQSLSRELQVEKNLYERKRKAVEEDLNRTKKSIEEQYQIKEKAFKEQCQSHENAFKEQQQSLEKQKQLLNLKIRDIPTLSTYLADLNRTKEEITETKLLSKNAYKAADVVRNLKGELARLRTENKNLEYKLLAYESMFPVLKEFEDEPLASKPDIPEYDDSKADRVSYWTTPTEYQTLSITERNQRALERYWNRNKTNSEIGADYEKSIGYWEYERKGWRVTYFGIDKGLEDLGRDLICLSPNENTVHIVQCKCWSTKKEIHENHINQLFGTTVRYFLEKCPDTTIGDFIKALENGYIVPIFYTTTKLSNTAKSFATSLGIKVREDVPLKMYPMIKCNISRRTQEKIYHLPFDQQYENVVIDPPEEFIALTVDEAEQAGFRRAYKWYGN